MVTPLRTKERLDQKFMVGYGYGGIDGKILVFNPMEKKLRIRKGCRVAELHPGGKFSPAGISKGNVEGTGQAGDADSTNGKDEVNKRERASGAGHREDRSVRSPSCRPRVDPICAGRSTDFPPFLPPSGLPLETQQPNSVVLPERQEYVRMVVNQEGVAQGCYRGSRGHTSLPMKLKKRESHSRMGSPNELKNQESQAHMGSLCFNWELLAQDSPRKLQNREYRDSPSTKHREYPISPSEKSQESQVHMGSLRHRESQAHKGSPSKLQDREYPGSPSQLGWGWEWVTWNGISKKNR
jgi:hypothetical protein